jgi:hypothetical protein
MTPLRIELHLFSSEIKHYEIIDLAKYFEGLAKLGLMPQAYQDQGYDGRPLTRLKFDNSSENISVTYLADRVRLVKTVNVLKSDTTLNQEVEELIKLFDTFLTLLHTSEPFKFNRVAIVANCLSDQNANDTLSKIHKSLENELPWIDEETKSPKLRTSSIIQQNGENINEVVSIDEGFLEIGDVNSPSYSVKPQHKVITTIDINLNPDNREHRFELTDGIKWLKTLSERTCATANRVESFLG